MQSCLKDHSGSLASAALKPFPAAENRRRCRCQHALLGIADIGGGPHRMPAGILPRRNSPSIPPLPRPAACCGRAGRSTSSAASGQVRARPEDRLHARLAQHGVILRRDDPPATTLMSARPASFSASISSGISVLWPAASDEAPTTSTSRSTASSAASRGVWNSGQDHLEAQIAEAEVTRLAPRSWPSWPILATRMRGLRPRRRRPLRRPRPPSFQRPRRGAVHRCRSPASARYGSG